MQIEVWADIICPWCGLGLHRLDAALATFEHAAAVEVVHRSFQLDPNAVPDVVRPVRAMLRARGVADEQITEMTRNLEVMAAAEGLTPYHVLDNQVGSTGLTHELLAFATAQGKHTAAWRALFRLYFGDARDVFTRDALVGIAGELGLDEAAAYDALTERRFRAQVEAEQADAHALGATGVPFFVIDRRYGLAGAVPPAQIVATLDKAWAESAARSA